MQLVNGKRKQKKKQTNKQTNGYKLKKCQIIEFFEFQSNTKTYVSQYIFQE